MSTIRRLCLITLSFCAIVNAWQSAESQAESHARQSYELARSGSLSESETEMREAIRLAPQNPLYHSALAGLLSKNGRLIDAKAELETALKLNPAPQARTAIEQKLKQIDLALGAALARGKRYQEGLAVSSDAAKRFGQDPKVWQMLGYFQGKLQLNSDAAQSYASAVQLDPNSSEANVGLATSQFAAGMEDQSVRTLRAGLAKFPEDPTHYQALGVVFLRLAESGRDTAPQAREMFEKALGLDGSLPEAHYELGILSLTENKLTVAREHLLIAERNAPADSRIHFALARLYRREGQALDSEREMKAFGETKAEERHFGVVHPGKE